jgi:hypothetical protein
MLVVCQRFADRVRKALDSAAISRELRPHFRKWLRFHFDFCSKYGHSARSKSSLLLFMAKLASKNQPEAKLNEAMSNPSVPVPGPVVNCFPCHRC